MKLAPCLAFTISYPTVSLAAATMPIPVGFGEGPDLTPLHEFEQNTGDRVSLHADTPFPTTQSWVGKLVASLDVHPSSLGPRTLITTLLKYV